MKKIIAVVGATFAPVAVFAQSVTGPIRNTDDLKTWLEDVMTVSARLILSAAVIYFLWGVFQYVKSGGDEAGKNEGRTKIINGIIGIAVMVSVWGLVNFLTSSANLDTTTVQAPSVVPGY